MMTSQARSGIGAWLCLSATLCLAVIVSSRSDPSELGAPVYWTWALTGLQVMALWVAGRGQAWGWMVGSAVQPGWIAYALMTDQLGFVIGCGISTGVQLSAYLRANGATRKAGAVPVSPHRAREHLTLDSKTLDILYLIPDALWPEARDRLRLVAEESSLAVGQGRRQEPDWRILR